MSLVGEAERALMRSKSVAAFNGEVFLQQRDEAAVVARSALSDIVGSKVKGTSASGGKLFRMMQVEHHASASIFFVVVIVAAVSAAAMHAVLQERVLQVGELPLPLPQLLLEQGARKPAMPMKYDVCDVIATPCCGC